LHSIQSGETVSKFMEHWEWLQLLCSQLVNADLPGVQSIPIVMYQIISFIIFNFINTTGLK